MQASPSQAQLRDQLEAVQQQQQQLKAEMQQRLQGKDHLIQQLQQENQQLSNQAAAQVLGPGLCCSSLFKHGDAGKGLNCSAEGLRMLTTWASIMCAFSVNTVVRGNQKHLVTVTIIDSFTQGILRTEGSSCMV